MRMRRAPAPCRAEAGTATASGPRDALPRLRLLVGRQHGDRITAVGLGLFAKSLHLRPHLVGLLPHARTRGGDRGARRACAADEASPSECAALAAARPIAARWPRVA
jgi:hypothetical protein